MKHLVKNDFFNLDRFFDDDYFPTIFRASNGPKMEIVENKSNVIVKAELPGLTKEDISIDLKESVLTLSGEKKVEDNEPDARYHRTEISYGSFQRSFHLNVDVDVENIDAVFENGILTITLPKAVVKESKKTIEIR
ncbi:MAG: Hsp20/alpha crystallin family protein [Vallitaleaceae bacterium]|nr:Hsp20/alpha crystallin family protein [Vallitaleaceae bacterium]